MKRFKITVEDGSSLALYYPNIEKAREHFPQAEIVEHTDLTHIEHINRMLDAAEICMTAERNGSTVYQLRFNTSAGACLAWLFQDIHDESWYDFCDYQLWRSGSTAAPILKTMSDPATFCKQFLFPRAEYAVLSYGGKLQKPVEIKGVRKFASVSFAGLRQCQLFLSGNDLYIKHNDYFSPLVGTGEIDPCTNLEKKVIQICHAWLRITSFVQLVGLLNASEIAYTIWPLIRDYHCWGKEEYNMEWMRFLEGVAAATARYLEGANGSSI